MRDELQKRSGAEASVPLWRRWLALACLLLVGVATSAQAVHVHGQVLPQEQHQVSLPADASQLPGSEANCQLCVAMHSAMVAPVATPVAVVVVETRVRFAAVEDRAPETRWHYAMFSRPPPVLETV